MEGLPSSCKHLTPVKCKEVPHNKQGVPVLSANRNSGWLTEGWESLVPGVQSPSGKLPAGSRPQRRCRGGDGNATVPALSLPRFRGQETFPVKGDGVSNKSEHKLLWDHIRGPSNSGSRGILETFLEEVTPKQRYQD